MKLWGHNFLKRHEAIIAARQAERDGEEIEAPDKWCDLCGGGEQTTRHIMSDCEALGALRQVCMGEDAPQPPYLMPISKVVTFLQMAKIPTLEIYKNYQEYAEQFEDISGSETEN